jgi:hypothetical protein
MEYFQSWNIETKFDGITMNNQGKIWNLIMELAMDRLVFSHPALTSDCLINKLM